MTGAYQQRTKKQVATAFEDLAGLTPSCTPRQRAEDRLARAKAAFTAAAAATLENRPGAAGMADVAMREVERARAAIEALDHNAGDSQP